MTSRALHGAKAAKLRYHCFRKIMHPVSVLQWLHELCTFSNKVRACQFSPKRLF